MESQTSPEEVPLTSFQHNGDSSRQFSKNSVLSSKGNNNSYDDLLHGNEPDFYGSVVVNTLRLDIDHQTFYEKVKRKRMKYFLSHHAAELEVAIDLFIAAHNSDADKALLAVLSAPCSQPKELMLISRLLSRGASARATDEYSRSPLFYSIQKGHQAVTERLVKFGASPTQADNSGCSPLDTAFTTKDDILAAFFLKHMDKSEVRRLVLRTGLEQPKISFQSLIEEGNMKETVIAILDSLVEDDVFTDKVPLYYSILEVDRKGITPDKDAFTSRDFSPLQLLSQSGDQDFVCHPVVTSLLDRKWKLFARSRFLLSGLLYMILLLLMTVAVILAVDSEDPAHYSYKSAADVCRAICEVIVLIGTIYYVGNEFMEIYRLRQNYLRDPYNFFDLGATFLFITVIPLRFTRHNAQWGVYSIAYTMSVLRILKYAAMLRRLRTYARILYFISANQIWEFLIMFFVLSLAFTGSFSLGLRLNARSLADTSHLTSSFWNILWTSFRILIEDDPILAYYNEQGFVYGWFCTIIFLVFLFSILVLLLNILIAQLTDVYESNRRDAVVEVEINRAFIVTRVELCAFNSLIFKKEDYRRRHYIDRETITSKKLSEYRSLTSRYDKELDKGDINITEQLSNLDATTRSIGTRLNQFEDTLRNMMKTLADLQIQRPAEATIG